MTPVGAVGTKDNIGAKGQRDGVGKNQHGAQGCQAYR